MLLTFLALVAIIAASIIKIAAFAPSGLFATLELLQSKSNFILFSISEGLISTATSTASFHGSLTVFRSVPSARLTSRRVWMWSQLQQSKTAISQNSSGHFHSAFGYRLLV
jgi:hypothetical protein